MTFKPAHLNHRQAEAGSALIIVLVALIVVAVGVLAYMSGQMAGRQQTQIETPVAANTQETAQAQQSAEAATPPAGDDNPVVARVDGATITRAEVIDSLQGLPPQMRQVPLEQLFPMALDQAISSKIVDAKAAGMNLASDPEVQKQMALAREQITRSVFVQKEVEKRMTEERLKAAYEKFKKEVTPIEEVKARHILVSDEEKAKQLITALKADADFAKLAKENSLDRTAETGGDLGYFAKTDVVESFADAAFKLKPGTLAPEPVKSQFGFHVVEVLDKRMRPVPSFEEAKSFLEGQVRSEVLEEMIDGWRKQAKIERFDINGQPLKETAPAAGAASETAKP